MVVVRRSLKKGSMVRRGARTRDLVISKAEELEGMASLVLQENRGGE